MRIQSFHKEEDLHLAVCEYIIRRYPCLVFTSEPSGLRVSLYQAKKLKRLRSSSALPDLWVLSPNSHHHALLLELKRVESSPYRKDGTIRKNKHVQEQAEMLQRLLAVGYWANFAVGFDDSIAQIDAYVEDMSFYEYMKKKTNT